MNSKNEDYQIRYMLYHGSEYPISTRDLCVSLHVSRRKLQKLIEEERRNGAVILSNKRGYYLPSTHEDRATKEIHDWLETRKHTLKAIAITSSSARQALSNMGQTYIEE